MYLLTYPKNTDSVKRDNQDIQVLGCILIELYCSSLTEVMLAIGGERGMDDTRVRKVKQSEEFIKFLFTLTFMHAPHSFTQAVRSK